MPSKIGLLIALFALPWLLMSASGCGVEASVEAKEEIVLKLDINAFLAQGKIVPSKAFPKGRIPSDFKVSFPFWYRKTYDLRNNPDIKKYKEQIRDLQVETLTYKVTQNSLNIDLPSLGKKLQVYAAKVGTSDQAQFTEVGYLLPFPAGKAGVIDRLYFLDTGETEVNGLIKDYGLELGLKGTLALDGAQDPTIPKGAVELTVSLSVSFKVDIKF